jgi:hypothetical protein
MCDRWNLLGPLSLLVIEGSHALTPEAEEAPDLWSEYLKHATAVAHFQAMTARSFELFVLERTSKDG